MANRHHMVDPTTMSVRLKHDDPVFHVVDQSTGNSTVYVYCLYENFGSYWRERSSVKKRYLAGVAHAELPIVKITDTWRDKKVAGARRAVSIRPAGNDIPANPKAPPYAPPPGHHVINVAAAPGMDLTITQRTFIRPFPRVNIFRLQDPARIPGSGEKIDPAAFFQTYMWVYNEAEIAKGPKPGIYLNPSDEQLKSFTISMCIIGRERPNGIDFVIRSGTLAALVSVNVSTTSGADRYWFGVKKYKNWMRLQIVGTSGVVVQTGPLHPPGAEAPVEEGWLEWFKRKVDTAEATSNRVAVTRHLVREALEYRHLENDDDADKLPPPQISPRPESAYPPSVGVETKEGITKPSSPVYSYFGSMLGVSEQTIAFIAEVGIGFVPIIGDAYDIGEFMHAYHTGFTLSGDRVGGWDWFFMGVGMMAMGVGNLGSIAKHAKGSLNTRDWAHLADLTADTMDPADKKWLSGIVGRAEKTLESGKELEAFSELELVRLRKVLAGVQANSNSQVLAHALDFDALMDAGGFKSPWLESRFLEAVGGGSSLDRKTWMRSLELSGDVADKRLANMIEQLLGPDVWRIERIDPDFHPGGKLKALEDYIDALAADKSGGPKGLGHGWDYERFPADGFTPAEWEGLQWRRGLPPDMPVFSYAGRYSKKNAIWQVPDYERHGDIARKRCWENIYFFEQQKRARIRAENPKRADQLIETMEEAFDPADAARAKQIVEAHKAGQSFDISKMEAIYPRTMKLDDIEQLPDWFIEYQLLRLDEDIWAQLKRQKVPGGPALGILQPGKTRPSYFVLDHEKVPRRGLRRMLAALVGRGLSPEQDLMRNMLRDKLGSVSAKNLRPKSPLMNAWEDGYARWSGVSQEWTRLGDDTFFRWYAGVDDETIMWLIKELATRNPNQHAVQEAMWRMNQEIMARNLPLAGLDDDILKIVEEGFEAGKRFPLATQETDVFEEVLGRVERGRHIKHIGAARDEYLAKLLGTEQDEDGIQQERGQGSWNQETPNFYGM